MTKKLNRAPMELDLDSFLQLQTSSDEDDEDLVTFPHRTVDEILNDSDSSTSSSSTSTSINLTDIQPNKPDKPQISETNNLKSPETLVIEPLIVDPFISRKSNPYMLGRSIISSSSNTSRPLPQLFGGGVKVVNPKPGAALAAAAAASRSRPTPHAAAIKSRRVISDANLQRTTLLDSEIDSSGDGLSTSFEPEIISELDSKLGETDEILKSESSDLVDGKHFNDENLVSGDVVEVVLDDKKESEQLVEQDITLSDETDDNRNVDEGYRDVSSDDLVDEKPQGNSVTETDQEFNLNSTSSSRVLPECGVSSLNEVNDNLEKGSVLMGLEPPDSENGNAVAAENVDVSFTVDETTLRSETSEVVEDSVVELNGKKGGKKSGKKSQSSMKPLDLAEDLEKKHAYSGLHWEEGAAAQPMRLEGIRRGPPAVGYLDIDANNVITRTISSVQFRREHGSPQVLAVHANFIAVGLSKGLTIVVPSKYSAQNADKMDSKMLMLSPQVDRFHSPVTSICFSQQGDLLLAGYGNGHIILWDVQRAATAKVITAEHTAPVVHTLFIGQDGQMTRQFKVVTGDCKGLVLLHTFSAVPLLNRYSVSTKCLLDGQNTGIVLTASPLLMEDSGNSTAAPGNSTVSSSGIGSMMGGVVGGSLFNEGSSLVDEGVVIFVTHQTGIVLPLQVQLGPKMKFYAHISKPDGVRDGAMPHTAWKSTPLAQSSSPESMGGETSDRVSLLVIAWDRKVQVAKLVKSELKVYREWTLDSAAIGVAWLDDQMLVILTSKRQFCLFSKEGNELHRTSFPVDLSGADSFIGYHTYFSNLFGNPEKAYNNCLAVRGATIYVLGPRHLVISRLLPWKERIQVLRKAGDWMGALDMAMRLYDGHAHGVIDLPRTLDAIRRAIMSYLVELILSYVDEVFSYISVAFSNQIEREEQVQTPGGKRNSVHSELEDQFARVGGVAVEFCVHIKRVDILFDDIFSKFVAVHHGGTFLELLEPYILKDMLGCLPPEIMQALVEHYSSKGWLQRVEQCVLHMDISSLDFNQVVRLCREHGLYGALIYVFNKGLDDFKAPLEELLLVLQNSQRENAVTIGYRMLVYLKYCFSGLAFPPGHGILQNTRLPSLRRELLEFLLEDSSERNSDFVVSFKLRIGVFPNLFHLLQLDTEATLEVLKLAFPEDLNSDHGPNGQNLEDEMENGKNTESLNLMVQSTVNSLVPILDSSITVDNQNSGMSYLEFKEIWPSKKDMGHLLEFIAYFVACGRATVTKSVLNHILEFLTLENIYLTPCQKIESIKRREKQMLTILRVVPESDWNYSYVLDLCEKAHYYQVCGYIHTKRHQYVAALNSYMKDLDEPIHAFSFINNMLLHLRDAEFVTFRTAVLSQISELLNLSREGAFFLIFDQFNKESEHILSELRSSPKSLFLYLKATIEVHLSGTLNFSSLGEGYDMDPQRANNSKDQSNEIELYLERLSEFPKLVRQNPVQISDDLIELYVELSCQFERSSVLKFLQTFQNYRVERCLRLCQEYRVIDAAAFLLERVGDVSSALLLTLSGLGEKFRVLDSAIKNTISSSGSSETQLLNIVSKMEEVSCVSDILHSSIGICQRNSKRLDPEESEFLWFQLLDTFCEPLRDPNDDKSASRGDMSGTVVTTFGSKESLVDYWRIPKSHKGAQILRKLFAQFIKEIVEGMIGGYVHLPTIMSKLLSDNGSQVFGDFKLIILGMLGSYGFEKRILDTAKTLIEEDTYYTMSVLKKGASHGYAPQNLLCQICGCLLSKESSASGIRVFNCGHTTHVSCEIQENGSGCPVCVPKKKTGVSRKNKSALTDNGLVRNSTPQTQGTNTVQHIHESDLAGVQQISRFEILSNLKKTQRSFQVESLPQLRLAPPAVYHEKIQKKPNSSAGESSNNAGVRKEKSSRQTKKSSLRFPLKSSIFGNEVTRKR